MTRKWSFSPFLHVPGKDHGGAVDSSGVLVRAGETNLPSRPAIGQRYSDDLVPTVDDRLDEIAYNEGVYPVRTRVLDSNR